MYIGFHMVLLVLLSTHRIVPNYKLKTWLTLSDMNSEQRLTLNFGLGFRREIQYFLDTIILQAACDTRCF